MALALAVGPKRPLDMPEEGTLKRSDSGSVVTLCFRSAHVVDGRRQMLVVGDLLDSEQIAGRAIDGGEYRRPDRRDGKRRQSMARYKPILKLLDVRGGQGRHTLVTFAEK